MEEKERYMQDMISIIVPVYNESSSIEPLWNSLKKTLDGKSLPFEVVFVDDGSTDDSWEKITDLSRNNPEVKGVTLSRNVGQHNACIAGFENSSGEYVITIDADLQDRPEIIPRIYESLKLYDVVGCRREQRKDSMMRRFLSSLMHFTVRHFTRVGVAGSGKPHDYGCMLRGYRRWVVEKVIELGGKSVYIPTFTSLIGGTFSEIEIEHGGRAGGRSKYGIRQLLGLYFDMITDISLFPIQLISLFGILLSLLGFILGIIIFLRRIFIGPEVEGVFTLFAFLFIFTGVLLVSVGLIGEYVGRIYKEVHKTPRYIVRKKTGFHRRLRFGVFAYSEVGFICLQRLIEMGEEVVFVVTHWDHKDENIWFRSVADLALKHSIPLFKPENINDQRFLERISSYDLDVIFSFYFRSIFGKNLLSIPPRGCINLHGSFLPHYRGRAPVNWAIINGEKETGVTFHQMVEKVDAGPIIKQEKIAIDRGDTALTLTKKIASIGSDLLREVVDDLRSRNISYTQQDERRASYYGKRTPAMGRIEWDWSSTKIYNYMRGLAYPFPGAFFMYRNEKVILWRGESREGEVQGKPGTIVSIDDNSVDIKTGEGCFRIYELKVQGRRITAKEFIRQFSLNVGEVLGG
jgi:undecaprenyl-phosphate 4-deoxy-4-formamido-L-arabinose transferase